MSASRSGRLADPALVVSPYDCPVQTVCPRYRGAANVDPWSVALGLHGVAASALDDLLIHLDLHRPFAPPGSPPLPPRLCRGVPLQPRPGCPCGVYIPQEVTVCQIFTPPFLYPLPACFACSTLSLLSRFYIPSRPSVPRLP